jgi:hypothetical protein
MVRVERKLERRPTMFVTVGTMAPWVIGLTLLVLAAVTVLVLERRRGSRAPSRTRPLRAGLVLVSREEVGR